MMGDLTYRDISENDYEDIINFVESSQDLFFTKAEFPLTKQQLEQSVKSRWNSTVVLKEDRVVGFANFYEVEQGNYCSIGNVIVSPSFRGCGIAQFLIEIMENIALEKYNVSEARLSCFNTNTRGILLYHRLGFLPYKIEKRIDKQGVPIALLHMKKEISII